MINLLKISTTLVIVFFLVFASFSVMAVSVDSYSQVSTEQQPFFTNDIDEEINSILKEGKIPSISACIIKNESLVWYDGYGKYNKFLRLKPTKETVYMVASISKSFAATAILQLYEHGKITSLDDDVSEYLPFILRNPKYPDVPITFKMLLSHQSSLSMTPWEELISYGIMFLFLPKYYPYPALKWHLVPGETMYQSEIWTDNKPGDAFNYSNTGYLILEYLIKQISGVSFDEYCKDNIFIPLNMTNSSFRIRDIKRMQRAIPYLLRGNLHVRLPFYPVPDSAAGGLVTSVEDLSHFLIAHMNNGTYNDVRILENSSIELMHTDYNSHYDPDSLVSCRYGFGWMGQEDKVI